MPVATDLEIPGIGTIHQRQDWEEGAWPVSGLSDHTGVYDDVVGHYPGAGDVPDNDYQGHVYIDPADHYDDLIGYYRQMQRSYARPKSAGGRGYSVGYSVGIDYLGGLTVLRGLDFNNAANAGSKLPGNWNHRSISAQFVTDLTAPATDQALYTFAMFVAWLRHHGHRAAVKRHDDGEYTSCPGAVGAQLSAGLGEPEHWARVGPPEGCAPLPDYLAPPSTEHPHPEEDAMNGIVAIYKPNDELVASGRNKTFGLLPGGDVRHLSGPDAELDRPTIPIRGVEHYKQCEALDAVWRNRRA